jgi:Na+/H+ antiporter NhaD/arsenite permease-like protein
MISFGLITAISSALLDNVTTVLLIAPVTIVISDTLEINPTPFLMTEILMANIGGTGAAILMRISDVWPEHIYREIEWKTIFFFAGLFILVGGLEKVGVLERLARMTISFTKGRYVLTTLFLLWISALASTIIDNIPFVATMIPFIHSSDFQS